AMAVFMLSLSRSSFSLARQLSNRLLGRNLLVLPSPLGGVNRTQPLLYGNSGERSGKDGRAVLRHQRRTALLWLRKSFSMRRGPAYHRIIDTPGGAGAWRRVVQRPSPSRP